MDEGKLVAYNQKVDDLTRKIMENDFVFGEVQDGKVYDACQMILSSLGASYYSVKGIEEMIENPNMTELQKEMARENLGILGKAVFRAMNLFFYESGPKLTTSVLDAESIEEFLPNSWKGLGLYMKEADTEATKEEKGSLLDERLKLFNEKRKKEREMIDSLLK